MAEFTRSFSEDDGQTSEIDEIYRRLKLLNDRVDALSNTNKTTDISPKFPLIPSEGIDLGSADGTTTPSFNVRELLFDTSDGFDITEQGNAGVVGITVPASALDILTTKGDLLTRSSGGYVRVGVGSNGQTIVADSAQTPGWKWSTPTTTTAGHTRDTQEITGNVTLTADPTKIYVRILYDVTSVVTPILTLPDPTVHANAEIWLKWANSLTSDWTIKRFGSEKIDKVAADKTMQSTGPRYVVLISNGTDWYTLQQEL